MSALLYNVTGGKWKCVHIDDPRSPEIRLPSSRQCMELTPSQIIAKLLPQPQPEIEPDPMQGLANDHDVTEDRDMLADINNDDDDMKNIAAVTDVDIEMTEAETEPIRVAADEEEEEKMEEDDDDDMPPLEGEEGTAETIAVSVVSFDHVNLPTKHQYDAVFIIKNVLILFY